MKTILKTSVRNFIHRPVTNTINLLGLGISLALVIILSVYCYSELTTDRFHENGDNVYLYWSTDQLGAYTPAILKDYIDKDIPEVESTVKIGGTDAIPVFQVEDREPIASDMIYADEDFFKLFTYDAISGNLQTALKDPFALVITESLSKKLFGNKSALGKMVKLDNNKEFTVSAVIKKPKANSCFSFSAVASFATQKYGRANSQEFTDWGWGNYQTFVLLKKGVNPVETAKKISNLFPENYHKPNADLTALSKIYFSGFKLFFGDYIHTGDKKKITMLLMVAILVLVIALINFVNISTSQWLKRTKQIGMIKIIGARRSSILRNMLAEAFLFFLFALVFSIILVALITPLIFNYSGIHFNQNLIYSPSFFILSLSVTFLLSVLFSLAPALKITKSKAVDNMQKSVIAQSKRFSLRGFLVAGQFAITIILIAFTVLVQKQVNFGSNKLGFNQENIVGIKMTTQLEGKKEVLKDLIAENPTVKNVLFTQYYPGNPISMWGRQIDLNGEKKQLQFNTFSADAGLFKMMGLKLVAGRFYTNDLSTDKGKIVVNEKFLQDNKIENPLGLKFSFGSHGTYEIIGVVKDFHYEAVTKPIAPLAIRNDSYASYCLVNLQTANFNSLHNNIQKIKTEAAELSPSFPVDVSFFDQAVENMYHSEVQFRWAFSLFAFCAIIISCMGIFAMSLFAIQNRVKEIGIRKVNGAKISEILSMLNKDFVKWVVIAFLIATPAAYYAMNKWLESFAYKTELSWWIFALAGLLALGIALLTVSWQSWKAATRNPVEALRYE